MTIEWSKDADKYIRKLGKPHGRRIQNAMEAFAEHGTGDVSKMHGTNGFRLRVGAYRAIFVVIGDTILVTRVGARGDVYK